MGKPLPFVRAWFVVRFCRLLGWFMNRDLHSLLDIVQSAERVKTYIAGISWNNFLHDEKRQDAVIMRLTTIGRISNRISEEARLLFPSIDWPKIRDLHHWSAQYDEIDLKVVWEIAQTEMTDLILTIKPVIPPEDPLFTVE